MLKAVWCCCQILTYALRPMFIKAQDFTPNHLYAWKLEPNQPQP